MAGEDDAVSWGDGLPREGHPSGVITLESLRRTIVTMVRYAVIAAVRPGPDGMNTLSLISHAQIPIPFPPEVTNAFAEAVNVIESVMIEHEQREARWRN